MVIIKIVNTKNLNTSSSPKLDNYILNKYIYDEILNLI